MQTLGEKKLGAEKLRAQLFLQPGSKKSCANIRDGKKRVAPFEKLDKPGDFPHVFPDFAVSGVIFKNSSTWIQKSTWKQIRLVIEGSTICGQLLRSEKDQLLECN